MKNKNEPEKIDWEEVKNKKQPEEKKSGEVSEERLKQIMKDVEAGALEEETPAKQADPKDEIKAELNKKFEKGKFRPANFVTFIFLTLASVLLIAELLIVSYFIFKGFINLASGINNIFGNGSDVVSVLSGFGTLLLVFLLILGLVVCAGGIYFSVMSIIDASKLNFLKDEDYMFNLRLKRLISFEIFPIAILLPILIFVLPFFGPQSILQYVVYVNIPMTVISLACEISFFVQSIVSRIRFKKSTTEENYKAVLSEKKRINRLYHSRQRSDGSGRLY